MAKGYGFERDLPGGGDSAADVIRNTVAAWLWLGHQYGAVKDFAADYMTDKALRFGLERMGVSVPESEPVNAEAIGRALGVMLAGETGIEVGNLLDPASVRQALRVEAVRLTAEKLGLSGVKTADQIADKLAGDVRALVQGAADGSDGELLAAVKVSEWAAELARRGAVREIQASTRPDAANNRERQRRYRDTHKRVRR